MSIYLHGGPRLDSRGLPEGMDPHKLYEYRYQTLVNNPSSAFESFLYKYIPFSILKSFAIAIDPLAPFKVAPGVITAVNRTRYRLTDSVLNQRRTFNDRYADGWSQDPNYKGWSVCWSPDMVHHPAEWHSSNYFNQQVPLMQRAKDTTRRTRVIGSTQGELEIFKGYAKSPPRTVRSGLLKDQDVFTTYSPPPPGSGCALAGGEGHRGSDGYDINVQGSSIGAVFPGGTYNALRDSEINFALALCQKNAISMLKGWSPNSRDYTLFRNAVELRDIPRSIASLRDTLGDLRKLFVSLGTQPELRRSVFDLKRTAGNIPGEYLSYHFGWKQTYKDLMDLLALPNRLAKKYNFLIRRNGKPTTFRVKRNILTSEKDVSGFDYGPPFNTEYDVAWQSRIERESELRLVINATFDFPELNVPSFRHNSFIDRIGLIPRPTDIYNLIPWTWLVDWFTGLGNYVELIDTMNRDQNLINWGMISCVTTGKVITEYRSKSDTVSQYAEDYVMKQVQRTANANNHTSVLFYECHVRKNVAGILDVKLTSDPSSLTAYQKSILGALLLQRTEAIREHGFRPRS